MLTNDRENPISIDVLGQPATDVNILEQVKRIVQRIQDVDDANSSWLRKQLNYIKTQYGKRRKKNVPWRGASNINVPLTEGIIRRWRPAIASLVLDAMPIAHFTAQEETDLEPARLVEPFFTWLFIEHMETPEEVVRLTDLIARRGHAYAREGWAYQTEQEARVVNVKDTIPQLEEMVQAAQENQQNPVEVVAQELAKQYQLDLADEDDSTMLIQAATRILQGEEFVRLTYERVVEDRPDWKALDPVNVIVEQEGDPEKAPFFAVVHRLTKNEILKRARDGQFDLNQAQALIGSLRESNRSTDNRPGRSGGTGGSSLREQIQDFLDLRGGVNKVDKTRSATLRTVVWEVYCELDYNGDGIDERYVFWYAPEADIVLSSYIYPMPFGRWPITLYKFEPQAERPVDSRGVPELLFDLQRLVDAYHNSRVNAGQMILSPVMQRARSSAQFGNNFSWRPGSVLEVNKVGDIAPVIQDFRILQGLFQEEQIERREAENFIGTFDATLSQLSKPTERRTAAEVRAINQLAANVFGLDARMFQQSMKRSMQKVWQLWEEWGAGEVFFRVTNQPQPLLAKKSEIIKKYDITPAGTPSSVNRDLLLANMERILQIVINDQTGRFDVQALMAAYFQLIDPKVSKLVVRDPEQTAAAQAVQQAAQQQGLPPEQAVI